jgi:septal ring factor EnvC (AmiA/AmiB activator)
MREAITDGLDRLADRLDPNTGLAAVVSSLETLNRLVDQGRDAAALAGPDPAAQAELAATRDELTATRSEITATRTELTAPRSELTTTQGRVTALEELVRARDAKLSALNEIVRRLSAVEALLEEDEAS